MKKKEKKRKRGDMCSIFLASIVKLLAVQLLPNVLDPGRILPHNRAHHFSHCRRHLKRVYAAKDYPTEKNYNVGAYSRFGQR